MLSVNVCVHAFARERDYSELMGAPSIPAPAPRAQAREQILRFLPICLPCLQTFLTAEATAASQLWKPGPGHEWQLTAAPKSKPQPARELSPMPCSLASFGPSLSWEISLCLGE